MRSVIIAAAALAFASGLAEARSVKVRSGQEPVPSPVAAKGQFESITVAATSTDEAAKADRTGSTAVLRSMLSAEVPPPALDAAVPPVSVAIAAAIPGAGAAPPAEPANVTKVAEPWCRSGRTVGAGSGFCLIN